MNKMKFFTFHLWIKNKIGDKSYLASQTQVTFFVRLFLSRKRCVYPGKKTMHIPSLFYGHYREVKPRCRRLVTKLTRGEALNDIIGADETIDTATQPGMLVLEGPSPLVIGKPNFHCYLLHDQIWHAKHENRLTAEIVEEVFNASLQTEWGVLGLIAYQNIIWFAPPEKWRSTRYQPMLKACLQFWDTFLREGERYSNGSSISKNLWEVSTTLKYILANMGVSTPVLKAPLPTGGLAALVALAREGDNQPQ